MARFVRSAGIVSRHIAGELVLVPLGLPRPEGGGGTANFYVLNDTGEFLWNKLGSPVNADELSVALAAEYGIDLDAARGDVLRFLAELSETGAVHVDASEEEMRD